MLTRYISASEQDSLSYSYHPCCASSPALAFAGLATQPAVVADLLTADFLGVAGPVVPAFAGAGLAAAV